MEKRLLNKKVIVTGGSRGIGAGIVKRLFNEGAEIIIAVGINSFTVSLSNPIIGMYLINCCAPRYDEYLDVPNVGNVWLGPAM